MESLESTSAQYSLSGVCEEEGEGWDGCCLPKVNSFNVLAKENVQFGAIRELNCYGTFSQPLYLLPPCFCPHRKNSNFKHDKI